MRLTTLPVSAFLLFLLSQFSNSGGPVFAPPADLELDTRWRGNSGAGYGLVFDIEGDYEQFFTFKVNADDQEYALYHLFLKVYFTDDNKKGYNLRSSPYHE